MHVYANGHLMSAADFDQNSSSSNSSASFAVRPTPQATNLLATNKIKAKSGGAPSGSSSSSTNAEAAAAGVGAGSGASSSSRHLKPQSALNGSPDSSLADECRSDSEQTAGKSAKPKSSPRHLLYEVLLSPIKRKVNHTHLHKKTHNDHLAAAEHA